MIEHCQTCGSEKAMSRCWRLSCPTNGGTGQALALIRADNRKPEQQPLAFEGEGR